MQAPFITKTKDLVPRLIVRALHDREREQTMVGRTLAAAFAALTLTGTSFVPSGTAVAGGGYHGGYSGHAGVVLLGVTAGLLFLDVVSRANRRYDDDYDRAPRRVDRLAEPR